MKRAAAILGIGVLITVGSVSAGHAQENGNSGKTIWDGVYTEAQATRGQKEVQQNCSACHSPTEWSNAMFIGSWSGRPVRELYNHLRMTMPFDSPGRLTREQYSDIVAYMLKLNKVPVGQADLPSDDDALAQIGITRQNR